MRTTVIQAACLLTVLGLFAGCTGRKVSRKPPEPGWVAPCPDDLLSSAGALKLGLASEKTNYQSWESIDLLVTVTNTTDEPVLCFAGAVELEVKGKGAEWIPSPIAAAVEAIPYGMHSLRPGEVTRVPMPGMATRYCSWRLPPGSYTVNAKYRVFALEELPVKRPPGKVWVGAGRSKALPIEVTGPSATYKALRSTMQAMRLADSLDEQFVRLTSRLAPEEAESELLTILRDRRHGDKDLAVWLLGRIGSQRAVPALTAIANGKDPSTFLPTTSRRKLGDARLRAAAREALAQLTKKP